MKNPVFYSLFLILLLAGCFSNNKALMFVGTYTNGASEGIYSFYLDQKTGELEQAQTTANNENPSFLAISADNQFLYAVAEVKESPGIDSGSVTSYRVLDGGNLEKISKQATKGYHPCHLSVSPNGKLVVASNYGSGSLSLFNVNDKGELAESFQQIQHTGSGPNLARQKEVHAHSALFDATGELLISADLGNDKIEICKKSSPGIFEPTKQGFVAMEPGSGPRHFVFSPDEKFIYVLNELQSSVSVLQKDGESFHLLETKSSLPKDYLETNTGADIHVSKDGRFVYSSNRGHNSIAVFKRDLATGKIILIETESVQGDWPRNFALSPNGDFLVVANQKSSNITVFKIDKSTGELDYTGTSVQVPLPVCLKFL